MDGKAHTDYLAALARVPAGNTIELRLGNTSDGTIVLPQKLPAMLEPEPEPELVYTPDVPSAIPLQQQPGRSDSSSVSAADDHRGGRSGLRRVWGKYCSARNDHFGKKSKIKKNFLELLVF